MTLHLSGEIARNRLILAEYFGELGSPSTERKTKTVSGIRLGITEIFMDLGFLLFMPQSIAILPGLVYPIEQSV